MTKRIVQEEGPCAELAADVDDPGAITGRCRSAPASLVLQIPNLAAPVLGIVRAIRLRTPLDGAYLLVAALMCFLTWRVTLFPKDLPRGVALASVLLPMVIPTPREPRGSCGGLP